MEKWKIILSPLQTWLDQVSALLTSLPAGEIILMALVLPVALAAFARGSLTFLGTLLLAAIALLNALEPSLSAITLAICAYFGSLVVALSGIQARRRAAALRAELISLRTQVDDLAQAESRRFLAELKAGGKAGSAHAGGLPVGDTKATGKKGIADTE